MIPPTFIPFDATETALNRTQRPPSAGASVSHLRQRGEAPAVCPAQAESLGNDVSYGLEGRRPDHLLSARCGMDDGVRHCRVQAVPGSSTGRPVARRETACPLSDDTCAAYQNPELHKLPGRWPFACRDDMTTRPSAWPGQMTGPSARFGTPTFISHDAPHLHPV